MKKLAIITTHPIQYNAPLFKLLTERKKIEIKVFYTWSQSKEEVYDARFGLKRSWDIPLLEGYNSTFVKNIAKHPDSNRFFGINNPDLFQQVKEFRPDAVLVFRWSVYSHFKIMQLLGKSPRLFFRGDSHLQNKGTGLKDWIKTLFLKFVYRNVDKAFFVGQLNRNYYLKYGLKEQQLVLAPHAIDNSRFSLNNEVLQIKANQEREHLQIPTEAVVFLYAGKFYALKELNLLIQSFKSIVNPNARLLLFGNGVQEMELKALAKDDNRIIFQPFKNQSEMPMVYRVGDVLMLPSRSETWGLAVNEAMACSRPAIVSDQCGCAPELIIEGKTGYSFKTSNQDDLVRCMRRFENRSMATKMGQEAFNHIESFSFDQIAEKIETAVLA